MLNGFPQWTVLCGRQLPLGDALAGFQLDLLSLTSMEPLLCHIHGTLNILFMSSSLLHSLCSFLSGDKESWGCAIEPLSPSRVLQPLHCPEEKCN